MKKFISAILFLGLISCQSSSPRNPAASSAESFELLKLVEKTYETETMKNVIPEEAVQVADVVAPLSANTGSPFSVNGAYFGRWRDRREELNINRLADFEIKNGQIERIYAMDRFGAKEYELDIQSFLYSKELNDNRSSEELQKDQPSYPADIVCNQGYTFQNGLLGKKFYSANERKHFNVYESTVNGQRIVLSPPQGAECQLTWQMGGKNYGVRIVTDTTDPDQALNQVIDGCFLPQAGNLKGVERFFLTNKYKSMTCVDSVNNVTTLEDPVDALRSKVEVLLGHPITKEFVQNYDPYAPLDMSQAPHFDSIYVSYLVFRADFYGSLLARLMEYHADRGTRVKLLVSDVIALKKDRAMFARMTQKHNNIKIQEYRYKRQKGESLKGKFDEFHRTMHVKLLITTSKDRPELNTTFIGGRNVHDGFVFKTLPGKARYPEMVDYGDGKDESFCHWRDFEIKVQDPGFTRKAAAHFLTLWNYDAKTLAVRSINQNVMQSAPADMRLFNGREPLVRHFMSFPYKDGHSLEVFYSEMVDSAEKSVKISTPYFRPTEMFMGALNRAVKRGVDITLITRLDLEGDTVDWLLSDANKAGVNQFWDKIHVYEYVEPKVILHSKIVLVDGKFSFIGSVNLNKRSFFHDLENGAMIYSPEFNQRMEKIYGTYLQDSRPIQNKLKTSPLKKVILDMFDTEF
ncbi:MAG: phosphatidylserine/phosphatidylglycerophosphate/cardiolipin synthase family protein [Bdellovibrionales bacterium]|nr:phosphatidylserine/phosphatidylglycerophosphate/cardiolipin synthase family protein [Bdellovibrionales bacterium]